MQKNILPSKSERLRGLITGIVAPIAFGFLPLFSMPLIEAGMSTASILTYRFTLSAIILFVLMLVRGLSLRISKREFFSLLLLGLIYVWSAAGVQAGYRYMPTGIATVIHFTYPIWVIAILLFRYKQQPAKITLVAILMAIVGVAFLVGLFSPSGGVSLTGFLIVGSTGVAYALYLVVMGKSGIDKLHPLKVSFYVMSTAAIGFAIIALFTSGIQPIAGRQEFYAMLALSLVSTVLANILLVVAVKFAGATTNSVLGALEPLTAVVVGVLFLNEQLTSASIVGILLIIASVTLIAFSGRIAYIFKVRALRKRRG